MMTSGDAGTAHRDGALRRAAVEQRSELLRKLGYGFEAAVNEIGGIGPVDRTRHVAGNAIDGFDFTAIAFRSARVDQHIVRRKSRRDPGRIEQTAGIECACIVGRRHGRHGVTGGQTQRDPACPSAVEHGNILMAQCAQQPPQPRSECAITGVVSDDLRFGRNPAATEPAAESVGIGPRVPPGTGTTRSGQIAIEMRVLRAGQMRLAPGGFAGSGIVQREPAVENTQIIGTESANQRFRIDQRGPATDVGDRHAGFARANRSRRLNRIDAVTPQIR